MSALADIDVEELIGLRISSYRICPARRSLSFTPKHTKIAASHIHVPVGFI